MSHKMRKEEEPLLPFLKKR